LIDNVLIIGAGSLGTSLAQTIAPNVNRVTLLARRASIVDGIRINHRNLDYYPTVRLQDNIYAISSLEEEIYPDIVFLCVPSSAVRDTCIMILKLSEWSNPTIVSTAKGFEYPSLKRMSQIIEEVVNIEPIIFSGPTFAAEMVISAPSSVTIAGTNPSNTSIVEEALSSEFFIVEKSSDIIGVELCSVLKNIYSIAFGICEGIDINDNAKYAIFTKSFQEMKKIVKSAGGCPETVDSFCGLGDLSLTSASRRSRNYTLGMLYGKRIVIDEESTGILFEGKKSILGIKKMCEIIGISAPVLDFVHSITIDKINAHVAFKSLWNDMRFMS